MCCILYCYCSKWASNGNPVKTPLCAILPSVLLGVLLYLISYDLGLKTMISDIYTNDMTAMKTVIQHYWAFINAIVSKRQRNGFSVSSSPRLLLGLLDKSAKLRTCGDTFRPFKLQVQHALTARHKINIWHVPQNFKRHPVSSDLLVSPRVRHKQSDINSASAKTKHSSCFCLII